MERSKEEKGERERERQMIGGNIAQTRAKG